MGLPLDGVRIVAVEQHGASPFGTLHLADLGAEVLKIEDPVSGGDVSRNIAPAPEAEGLFFASFNRGKKSVMLDLRSDGGREALQGLLRCSDALVTNLRPDAINHLDLRYERLRDTNPALVCVALTGYGLTGPRSDELGYDPVIQARAGWMSQTGAPDAPPTKSGLSLVDLMAGQQLALAVTSGLVEARRTGVGREFDLALFDTAVTALSYLSAWQLTGGHEPQRRERSAHPSLVPAQLFRARDGWVMVNAFKPEHWRRLAEHLGRLDLLSDKRYANLEDRLAHRGELTSEIDAALATHDVAHWIEVLSAARIAVAPVNTIAQALRDPQVLARGLLTETEYAGRTVTSTGTAFSPLAREEGQLPGSAPALGAHTRHVLKQVLGASDRQLARWKATGAFGPMQPAQPEAVIDA